MLRCMEHFYIKYLSDVGMEFTHFPLNGVLTAHQSDSRARAREHDGYTFHLYLLFTARETCLLPECH